MNDLENGARIVLGGCACSHQVDRRWQGERSGGDFGQRLRRARRVKMLRSVSVSRRAVGTRWFRKAGGMPPSMFGLTAKPLCGRYLSFAEREEIALLRVQGYSMQEVARRLGREWHRQSSEELRRNAATRKRRPRVSCDDKRNGTPGALLAAQSRRSLRATRR